MFSEKSDYSSIEKTIILNYNIAKIKIIFLNE